MTDQTNAELIAFTREEIEGLRRMGEHDWADALEGMMDALEAAEKRAEETERERDQLAAVTEKAREWAENVLSMEDAVALRDVLATAPDDALREHDAALIEGLADEIAVEIDADAPDDFLRGFDAGSDAVYAALREKARQRREERA